MSRQYTTTATMFVDRFSEKVVQPDERLVGALHRVLDTLPDNTALMIDLIVADLLRFHNPRFQAPGTMTIKMPHKEETQ